MIVLAIDTALEACSAAILDGDLVLASRSEPMPRGHQERLAALVRELMAQGGADFAALASIAVTVGPGSFTGLRVGMAFAKGLGFALGIPVVGVGTLEALAASEAGVGGVNVGVIDARRDQVYVQPFASAGPLADPEAMEVEAAASMLISIAAGRGLRLIGPGAAILEPRIAAAEVFTRAGADPAVVARLAGGRDPAVHPPEPLYLRAPDARLPA